VCVRTCARVHCAFQHACYSVRVTECATLDIRVRVSVCVSACVCFLVCV